MAEGVAVGSTFFEVRFDEATSEEIKNEKQKEPTGGMSFSVTLENEESEKDKSLQLAARLHRIKSEMRRSDIKMRQEQEKNERQEKREQEKRDSELDIEMDNSEAPPETVISTPSETGTYTLRLDSSEVRERKNLINITSDSIQEQNSATESTDQAEPLKQEEGDSPVDFEIPTAVSARITEWFNRNEMAESRTSENSVTDGNLDDIREKAKNRIKELTDKTTTITLNHVPPKTVDGLKPESKIILSREDRTQKKAENVRTKGANPQVRLTRAMLLRKNRALGIKTGDETKKDAPNDPQKSIVRSNRQISARLDNLSKPKRSSDIANSSIARQRSFSHEDTKVPRGRPNIKPVESTKLPVKKDNRSTSLNRGLKDKTLSVAKRTKPDAAVQPIRLEKSTTSKTPQKRSASLSRSSATNLSVKSRNQRTSKPTSNIHNQSSSGAYRINSSSSSSRNVSRPATATSVRESHENSILYSLHVISDSCLQKTRDILAEMIGDISETNDEIEKLNASGENSQTLESVFGRICALDKCLGKIRATQEKSKTENSDSASPDICVEPVKEDSNPKCTSPDIKDDLNKM